MTKLPCQKNIDSKYAEELASDLAFMVLQDRFKETKQWYLHKDKINDQCSLKDHYSNNTWPTPKQIKDFGHKWHKLPLKKCFDVPDMIDPSIIYADKSHSMNRSEVLSHIQNNPNSPIPTRKVLETAQTRSH